MLEIGHRTEGLVDVLKDRLCAISSGIGPEGLGIAQRRSNVVGGRHVDGSGNTPTERMMHQRFGRSAK